MTKTRRSARVTNPPARVSADELAMLRDLAADAQMAKATLDRYANKVAAKYAIGATDSLDLQTGMITRKEGAARG